MILPRMPTLPETQEYGTADDSEDLYISRDNNFKLSLPPEHGRFNYLSRVKEDDAA